MRFVSDPALEKWAGAVWVLPAVILLGLLLRAAHLVFLSESPFASSLVLDARAYDEWARSIAAGAWIGHEAFWVDPLYAYVLAALYRFGGTDLLLPRLANMAFGVATAVVAARIASRIWRSRSAAIVAALLVSIFIPAIHFEGQIEKTALSTLLLAVGVDLFLVGTSRAIVGAGIVGGLAALSRGNILLLLVFAGFALAFGWDRERADPVVATRGRRIRRSALFLAGALPLILLATLHNYLATGGFVATTTNLGINLYLGNHSDNLYGYYEPPSFLQPSTNTERPDFRAEAERRTGRQFSDRALSDYWTWQSWESIQANPQLATVRVLRKLRLALHNDEVPDSDDVTIVARWSPILRSPILWFGQLLSLALLGVAVGWRRRGVRVVVAVSVLYVVSLLPFFIMARLRIQLLPLLAVLGSGASVWLVASVRSRQVRGLLLGAAILAFGGLVAFHRPDWMAQRRTSSLAIGWYNLGASLANEGRTDEAIRAYERAVEIDAPSVPAALRVLGRTYQQRGDYVRAETVMRRVQKLRPESRSAGKDLRVLYEEMLADERWRNDSAIRRRYERLGVSSGARAGTKPTDPVANAMSQARLLQSEGRDEEAIALLQKAVRDGPYDENIRYMLGQMMERYASPEAMIEFFSQTVAQDQKPQTSHYFWALGLIRAGQYEEAESHFRRALEIDPAHEMTYWKWGLLLESQDRLDEALDRLAEATTIHPEFKVALQDAARVAERLGRSKEAQKYRSRSEQAKPGSVRRFLYWARYLQAHGRHQAAWTELTHFLAEQPNDDEALHLRDEVQASLAAAGLAQPTAAPLGDLIWTLSEPAYASLVSRLATEPHGTSAWIAYDGRDVSARNFAQQLATAFEEAGWSVRRTEAPFALRSGVFLLAADDPPSEAATAVMEAIDLAQVEATVASGYRAYADERRQADSNWGGFQLEPDQQFVIAVGRPPR